MLRRPGNREGMQLNDLENPTTTLQKVDITFRPIEIGASVLLHSESQRYIHQMMVSRVCNLRVLNFGQPWASLAS